MPSAFTPVELDAPRGRIIGALAEGEDAAQLREALLNAPEWVSTGARSFLSHEGTGDSRAQRALAARREAVRKRRLKRFTFLEETAAGQRVVKIAEVQSFGNALLGLLQTSTARQEHVYHARAVDMSLAAVETRGFLEWRDGKRLLRACQVQTLLSAEQVSLDTHLARELASFGDAALEPFAQALARMHARPFFHADLKGFHGFVTNVVTRPSAPSTYDLQWIDMGRVSFGLSPRQRIINLYQALRFVVPPHPSAHRRFMEAYTRSAGWCVDAPERALARVHAFLAHKFLTHPIA